MYLVLLFYPNPKPTQEIQLRMASPQMEVRSPPQYIRNLTSKLVNDYQEVIKKISQKKKAIEKLSNTIPKSIKSNIELQISPHILLAFNEECHQLKNEFNLALEIQQQQHCAVIIKLMNFELKYFTEQRQKLLSDFTKLVLNFYHEIHENYRITTDLQHNLEHYLTSSYDSSSTPCTVLDYRMAIQFATLKLNNIDYEHHIHLVEVKQAKKERSEKLYESMEFETEETNHSLLVSDLVQQELTKQLATVNRDLHLIQNHLKYSASGNGAPTGAPPLQQNTKSKNKKKKDTEPPSGKKNKKNINDGEKVPNQQKGKNRKNKNQKKRND